MIQLAAAIATVLAYTDINALVAVAAGDAEIERAHEMYLAGDLAGYVALADSTDGTIITRQCATGDVDTASLIDGAVATVFAMLGVDVVVLGATQGEVS